MKRPFVYVNMAMTADGKITSASREYPVFTSAFDRRNMDRLRAEADAILVGAGTLRADDPPLQVRDAELQAHRRSLGKPDALLEVLVTATARIDPGSRFVREDDGIPRVLATTEIVSEDVLRGIPRWVEVWRVGAASVNLPQLLSRLSARGVARLLVEGGGELNWSFVREGLVDEIFVTVAPSLLGGRSAPTLLEGEGFSMDRRVPLRLLSVDRQGDELYCRYEVVR